MESVFVYNTPHFVFWDWRIAADLFLGGIGVGAFLVAVVNSLYYKDKYPSVSKAGAVLSPPLVILGLLFMLAESGHPFRLYRTLTGFNVSSPISWGGPLQGLMVAIGLVYAYLWVRPRPTARLRRLVGIVGIPVAALVATYHGWLLAAVKARPLWSNGLTTVAALSAMLVSGIAVVLLALCVTGRASRRGAQQDPQAPSASRWMVRDFRCVLLAALVLHGVIVLAWWTSLSHGPAAAREAAAAAGDAYGPLLWIVGAGLGLAVPILLLILEMVRHRTQSDRVSVPLTILTAALILVGGFAFRYAVVIGGQLS